MVRLRPSHKKNHGYIDHLKSGDSDSIMDNNVGNSGFANFNY